jgi:hypothetical protein
MRQDNRPLPLSRLTECGQCLRFLVTFVGGVVIPAGEWVLPAVSSARALAGVHLKMYLGFSLPADAGRAAGN